MPVSADNLSTTGQVDLELAGEWLCLRADHSVFWPARRTLFVADTHFGKSGVFRRQGMSVPSGTTDADLARLEAAIAETQARRLIILGDFVHAPPAADEPWLARFAAWRAQHSHVEIMVTRGNHDRVKTLPMALDIDWQPGARHEAPFVCQHEPGADERGPVLAGHIHPVVRLRAGSETLRLPAFWRHADGLMLPAFCSFAGGGRIEPAAGDQLFVIGDNEVIEAKLGVGASR